MIPLAVGALDTVVPRLAARWAARLFSTPPPPALSERARRFLSSGRRFDVDLDGLKLAAWSWGDPADRTIVLYHGWGGRASQMNAFVAPLLDAGFHVVAMDAPAHGASEGKRSALPLFAAALRALAQQTSPPYAVVAHSMGGASTALAMREGLPVERVVFIGAPSSPFAYLDRFADAMHLRPSTVDLLTRTFERRYNLVWNELSLPYFAPAMRVPLLVVHDEDDREVSYENATAIAAAWPGARLLTTHGLGHRKILHAPEVVRAAVDFVRNP